MKSDRNYIERSIQEIKMIFQKLRELKRLRNGRKICNVGQNCENYKFNCIL